MLLISYYIFLNLGQRGQVCTWSPHPPQKTKKKKSTWKRRINLNQNNLYQASWSHNHLIHSQKCTITRNRFSREISWKGKNNTLYNLSTKALEPFPYKHMNWNVGTQDKIAPQSTPNFSAQYRWKLIIILYLKTKRVSTQFHVLVDI